jgi:UDP-N-acetylmuramyl pentapeptide phosphotransferase/UDP-N-acetylglucosamine-1-phosphate transferase
MGAAIGVSTLIIAGLRRLAWSKMLDVPNPRSSHEKPTLRGGGLAIVFCVLLGLWVVYSFLPGQLPFSDLLLFSLCSFLIACVSWLDDLYSIPTLHRFAAHSAGALCVVIFFGHWNQLCVPILQSVNLRWMGFPITIFWIVGLTNAYNFMDGIDGLAGGQAIISGLAWAGLGILADAPFLCATGALLAGSSSGFLFHNWPPARIFMGDVGSAFIGFTLAFLPVFSAETDPRWIIFGVLVVWPFIFDTLFTLFRRIIHGENIFVSHRSHLYQRLVISGYKHRTVVLFYMGIDIICITLAFMWVLYAKINDYVFVIIPIFLSIGLWQLVARAELKSRQQKGRGMVL